MITLISITLILAFFVLDLNTFFYVKRITKKEIIIESKSYSQIQWYSEYDNGLD